MWLQPLLSRCEHARGRLLQSRGVCGVAGEMLWKHRAVQSTAALMRAALSSAPALLAHSFRRNHSADVNTCLDIIIIFLSSPFSPPSFLQDKQKGGLNLSFLLLSTKKQSCHGNLCFHGRCCIALQRKFIKRHIYTYMLSCECGCIL